MRQADRNQAQDLPLKECQVLELQPLVGLKLILIMGTGDFDDKILCQSRKMEESSRYLPISLCN